MNSTVSVLLSSQRNVRLLLPDEAPVLVPYAAVVRPAQGVLASQHSNSTAAPLGRGGAGATKTSHDAISQGRVGLDAFLGSPWQTGRLIRFFPQVGKVEVLYFLFDAIGRARGAPLSDAGYFYGFLAVAIPWQIAFLVVGSAPGRFRPMMIPSAIEKFGYTLTLVVLYAQGRLAAGELLPVAPDFLLGVLFAMAFAKTSVAGQVGARAGQFDGHQAQT